MTAPTAPDELFREIRELAELVRALVATPDTVRWHWPTFYLLYVEFDRMSWSLQRAAGLFERQPGKAQDADEAGDVQDCCAVLGRQLRASMALLWQVARGTMSRVNDPRLQAQLRAHLHPKSSWYQALRTDYLPGRLSADGRYLLRTILIFEPDAPERIGPPQEQFLLRQQAFDLGSEASLAALVAAARAVSEGHTEALRALGRHFVAHCTIADLLHPSSV